MKIQRSFLTAMILIMAALVHCGSDACGGTETGNPAACESSNPLLEDECTLTEEGCVWDGEDGGAAAEEETDTEEETDAEGESDDDEDGEDQEECGSEPETTVSDLDGDGAVDDTTTSHFDEDCALTLKFFDNDSDEVFEKAYVYVSMDEYSSMAQDLPHPHLVYFFDLSIQSYQIGFYRDDDYDGDPELFVITIFDENGRATGRESYEDTDPAADTVQSYTYDEQGRLVQIDTDVGNDGTIDVVQYNYYDCGGAVLIDYGNDGEIDVGSDPCAQ